MADQSLLTPQPANLSSDAGNLWLEQQSLYLAEREADRGQPDNANTQLTKAAGYRDSIQDPSTLDQGKGLWTTAKGYCDNLAAPATVATNQELAAASDANYQAGQTLTPDQEAALQQDNLQTEQAKNSSNPNATYAASSLGNLISTGGVGGENASSTGTAFGNTADSLEKDVKDVEDKLPTLPTLKVGWYIAAGVFALVMGAAVAWKLRLI
ncbi:MAG TPA: hypothetical protein VFF73_14500 [Planctomycetota bacterium]|nr:hypothetical protein [Planctomycetota bacterium]